MKPLEELLEIAKSAKENPWINQANSHQDIATLTLADAVIDLITQLKDARARLAECETALNKAIEFGEYAEWAINESKDLQQLDIDARAYLSKWAVK